MAQGGREGIAWLGYTVKTREKMVYGEGAGRGDSASATFWPHTGVLIVRNTQDNLDMVDALVDQANASQPKQVEIESKFIEIEFW